MFICVDLPKTLTLSLHNVGKAGAGAGFVDLEQRLIGFRIERVFGSNDLPLEQPREASRVEITTFERLCPEMIPKRAHEPRIGALVRRSAVIVTLTGDEFGRARFVSPSNSELKIRAWQTTGKTAVLFHQSTPLALVLWPAQLSKVCVHDVVRLPLACTDGDNRHKRCHDEHFDPVSHVCVPL